MDSRLLVVAAVLLAVAVPTAAVTVAQDEDPIDVGGAEVTLQPHDGPNGAYATVEDGELEVAFERLNDGARTTADEVFTVEATGDQEVVVWATVEADGVETYRGDDPGVPIDDREHAVVLEPGESVAVGFEIDADEQVPESGTVTVHAEADDAGSPGPSDPDASSAGSDFVVTNLSAPDEVAVDEQASVVATVENVGDADGEYVARLVVDGTVVDQRAVAVPAGEARTVTFERSFDRPGEYELAVGDQRRTLTVFESATPSARFEVSDVRIVDDEIRRGANGTFAATVENVGDAPGETTVELVVGGAVVDERTVALDPGERATVTFERPFEQTGVFAVAVGGQDAGDLTVLSGSTEGRLLPSSVQTAAAGPVLVGALVASVSRWRNR